MENKVLATVAGEEITEAEFNAFLQNVPREQQAYLSNPAMRSHYLDQLIALHLFAKDGADQKLDETEEFKHMICLLYTSGLEATARIMTSAFSFYAYSGVSSVLQRISTPASFACASRERPS